MKVVFDKYLAKMRLDFENASGRTVYQQNLYGMHDDEKPVDYVLCNLLENAQGGDPAWWDIVRGDDSCLMAFSAMNDGMFVWPESGLSFTNNGYTFANGVATPAEDNRAQLHTSLDLRGMAIPNGLTIVGEWDFTDAPVQYIRLVLQSGQSFTSSGGLILLTYEYQQANIRYFRAQIFDSNDEQIDIKVGNNVEKVALSGNHCVALVVTTVNSTPTMLVYIDSYMWTHSNSAIASNTNADFGTILSSATSQTAVYNGLTIGYNATNYALPFTTMICYDRALSPTELRTLMTAINPNPGPWQPPVLSSLMLGEVNEQAEPVEEYIPIEDPMEIEEEI